MRRCDAQMRFSYETRMVAEEELSISVWRIWIHNGTDAGVTPRVKLRLLGGSSNMMASGCDGLMLGGYVDMMLERGNGVLTR